MRYALCTMSFAISIRDQKSEICNRIIPTLPRLSLSMAPFHLPNSPLTFPLPNSHFRILFTLFPSSHILILSPSVFSSFRIPTSEFRILFSHFRIPHSAFSFPTSFLFPLPHSTFRLPFSHLLIPSPSVFSPSQLLSFHLLILSTSHLLSFPFFL